MNIREALKKRAARIFKRPEEIDQCYKMSAGSPPEQQVPIDIFLDESGSMFVRPLDPESNDIEGQLTPGQAAAICVNECIDQAAGRCQAGVNQDGSTKIKPRFKFRVYGFSSQDQLHLLVGNPNPENPWEEFVAIDELYTNPLVREEYEDEEGRKRVNRIYVKAREDKGGRATCLSQAIETSIPGAKVQTEKFPDTFPLTRIVIGDGYPTDYNNKFINQGGQQNEAIWATLKDTVSRANEAGKTSDGLGLTAVVIIGRQEGIGEEGLKFPGENEIKNYPENVQEMWKAASLIPGRIAKQLQEMKYKVVETSHLFLFGTKKLDDIVNIIQVGTMGSMGSTSEAVTFDEDDFATTTDESAK